MAGTVCPPFMRGRVGRFTKIDRCGEVVPGPLNTVVTEGIITVTMTPTLNAGTTITVTTASGRNIVNDVPTPRLDYITASVALTGVDPVLLAMLTNQETWAGVVAGEITGFTLGTDVDVDAFGVAIELWSGIAGNVCEDGSERWGYFLLPWLKGGMVDAITWANDAINFTISGLVTKDGNQWGVGPYDVTRDETDVPAPLRVPLGELKHFLSDTVLLEPPLSECGGQPLGVEATTITAGIPATLTPAFSYPPADLADAVGVTASPATAWTTGQYVLLGDGSQANWNGTAWEAGPA
jgi:hypothetical protein